MIKKAVLFISLFTSLLSIQKSQAQNSVFYGMVYGGVCTSQIEGDGIRGFNQFGFNGGVGGQYTINNKLSTGFDLLFNSRGSRDYNTLGNAHDTVFVVRYLDVPVRINYLLNKKFTLTGGPYVGLLIDATSQDEDRIFDITNAFFPIDWGLRVGTFYKLTDHILAHAEIARSVTTAARNIINIHLFVNVGLAYKF